MNERTDRQLKEIEWALSRSGFRTTQAASVSSSPAPIASPALQPIAIIGLSGFLPGSDSVDAFWQHLDDDRNLLEELPSSRFDRHAFATSAGRWGGFVPDVAGFDPDFFGVPRGEAATMDPRQRLLLMSAYQAIADAGYWPQQLRGSRTGVFVAAQDNEYLGVLAEAGIDTGDGYAQACMLANRISYHFDWRGASEVIDAQCAGAAVAIHRAVGALRTGEIGLALVGGANLLLRPDPFELLGAAGQLSPEPGIASFGPGACGHLRAEGVVALLLKPLVKAKEDGDPIYALVRHSAVNYNGRGGASIAAPNLESHIDLIADCYEQAGIDPRELGYIEAQGMGNVLADLTEWSAFNGALRRLAHRRGVALPPGGCRVSTVKPMMGHMESTAALGAVLKIVRSLRTSRIHKVLGFSGYQGDMEVEGAPCAIAAETTGWPRTGGARLAGLHAYGMGGTNAHVLIEEYLDELAVSATPAVVEGEPAVDAELVPLSAPGRGGLVAMAQRLRDFLHRQDEPVALRDLAYTLQVGREAFAHRVAWIVKSCGELAEGLDHFLAGEAAGDGASRSRVPMYQGQARDAARAGGSGSEETGLCAQARAWVEGGNLDALAARHDGARRVHLPAYPFDRRPYWVEATALRHPLDPAPVALALAPAERPLEVRIRDHLTSALGELLQLPAERIDTHRHLYDLGVDSVYSLKLLRGLSRAFGLPVRARDALEHPSIDALVAHFAGLAQEGAPTDDAPDATPPASGRLPLSEGQKGLWVLQRMAPDMSAYNIPLGFHVGRPLDAPSLQRAFDHLVTRYPMLASTFVQDQDGVARCSAALPAPRIVHEEIRDLDRTQLLARMRELAARPFALDAETPVRLHVLRQGASDHFLLFTFHHIVFDGGSFLPVMETFLTAYLQAARGDLLPSPQPDDAHVDFVSWEQRMLAGEEGARHRRYWTRQLAGPLPTLALATDHPRASHVAFRGQTHALRTGNELGARLRSFAGARRLNPSMVFLALFKLLLHRYGGQDDLIVGVAEQGRAQEGLERAVGYFVNMLPIRSREVGARSLAALAGELQLTLADALDHAAYPFPVMVRDLGMGIADGLAPVFQVAFEYQNVFSGSDLKTFDRAFGEPLAITLEEALVQEGEYELVLEVRELGDDFALNLKYNPTLYEPATIAAMAAHLLRLADQALADPDAPAARFEMLDARERRLQLEEWNATSVENSRDLSVHRLFERQVQRSPQATALVFGEQRLSYAELDLRSSRLALQLQCQGIGPEVLVALCVERSPDMVTALLGIAKSGGAWLPLDPRYPDDRLRYMLRDSGARVLLTQPALQARAHALVDAVEGTAVRVVTLDGEEPHAGADDAGEEALQRYDAPDRLAYVIYTSGSTGRPKGVMVEHAALTNFLLAMAKTPGIAASDRLLAVTTYCFDIALLELLLPLTVGACCCVCPADKVNDAEELQAEIARLRPTLMQATPSTWMMLLAHGWRNPEGLKILCGGEPLPPSLRQRFADMGSSVWNMYGPTETTIWSTVSALTPDKPGVDIGHPIDNTWVRILDAHRRLVPAGQVGELCIGGDGLARGYLNNSELTSERFIADPFEPGARLYRTGDLARWRRDGRLEHLGRLDRQVKVRGFRVEPGDIEACLAECAGVAESRVLARQRHGVGQLVAYYTTRPGGPAASVAQLREWLAQRLPDYMVPALFVLLDAFPLTANGKVDTDALSAMEPAAAAEAGTAPAQSDLERDMLSIWKDLLGVPELGATDRFLEAGGNSVLAVLLAGRISQQFGLRFRPSDLFRYPTVREACVAIAGQTAARPMLPPAGANADVDGHTAPAGQEDRPDSDRHSLAIVGIACHVPGADTPRRFWRNLREGRESSTPLSAEDLRRAGVPESTQQGPGFVPVQYSMTDKARFDARFFNISDKNALFLDPQCRVLLEHAWQAVEDAGYTPEQIEDTAVFMSASNGFYKTLLHQCGTVDAQDEYAAWIAGQGGTIPTTISYRLGLKGPSFAVHSNCSSSLVGLHLAWRSLLAGEARSALVGAATLFPLPGAGHQHHPGMNFSSDGHCRAFDAAADGLVGGEGVVVVMLKRVADAIEDGDHIYALVRGVAVNNDGSDKAGYYAPGVKGQAAVVRKALEAAGVRAHDIGYVEAHGTGTELGDPVEVMALHEAYGGDAGRPVPCGIGSVKPNIGHLDVAAGLAGLVKVALSLHHGEIPPSINYQRPNPQIGFEDTPFRVVETLTPWPDEAGPRLAGLSSFGIGGTNAHAILEAYRPVPSAVPALAPPRQEVIVLSAQAEPQLRAAAARLRSHLAESRAEAGVELGDVAFTLQQGRRAMAWRLAFLAEDVDQAIAALERFEADGASDACFSGQAGAAAEGPEDDQDQAALVAMWISASRFDKVARAWVRGAPVDWSLLHAGRKPRRIGLPTYPFGGDRYWPEGAVAADGAGSGDAGSSDASPGDVAVRVMQSIWQPMPAAPQHGPDDHRHRVLLCGFSADAASRLSRPWQEGVCTRLRLEGETPDTQFSAACLDLMDVLRAQMADPGTRSLTQVVLEEAPGREWLQTGLLGLLRAASRENPRKRTQLVTVQAGDAPQAVAAKLAECAGAVDEPWVRYAPSRLCLRWQDVSEAARMPAMPWREGGVYLLTGGAGGLGLLFAEEIAARVKTATLVLAQRSPLGEAQRRRVAALCGHGMTVYVRQADVGREDEVRALVEDTMAQRGRLDGILHAAGAVRDGFVLRKRDEDALAVLAPKVAGVVHLDRATCDLDLDFFALFSSAAAVLGSAGQADYCAANGFLDGFADARNRLVESGRRRGLTLAIGWPLWRDGGMRPQAHAQAAMRDATGLLPLERQAGLEAFYRSLASGSGRTLVLYGGTDAVDRLLGSPGTDAAGSGVAVAAEDLTAPETNPDRIRLAVTERLKGLLAQVLRTKADDFEVFAPLERYGIDSIAVTQLNARLEAIFPGLAKTLFYQFPTVDALAGHLAVEHPSASAAWVAAERSPVSRGGDTPRNASASPPIAQLRSAAPSVRRSVPQGPVHEPIAIVGISGRYPDADDLETLWENLAAGRDSIREIPAERWDVEGFFHAGAKEAVQAGRSYSKWGGFLDGFADFDPLFFNISPREAASIDPQERLFLQCAWHAVEDAGYTRESLRNRSVGVFVGITKTGFDLHGPALWRRGSTALPHTSFGSVANRVSYCMDLTGPSMPIDTMCSSSLTAIHEACVHIRSGECEMAIAGGVNLYLHPATYVALCSAYMLSSDGRCKSFGLGGDGFVPGEGVGAVVLKPLSAAERDGDSIHALIRGSSINHGGRTRGYTVPSPDAQARLVRDCLDKADIDARTVTYVEAHGTGTALGDPIEVAGLSQAFARDTGERGFCRLGAIKSNFGHLEAAAGIAGLSKIVMQFRHGQIAPSLHAAELNPNIDFAATPFIVQQRLTDWPRLMKNIDGEIQELPRRAGLSSFGAGGANAHLVLEEYVPNAERAGRHDGCDADDAGSAPHAVVLSARNGDALRRQAEALLAWLDAQAGSCVAMRDLAFTLQTAREAFDERLGIVAGDARELADGLRAFLAGTEDARVCHGRVVRGRERDALQRLGTEEAFGEMIASWCARGEYDRLLALWTTGLPVDWARLHAGTSPRRIRLPGYAFDRQRLWLDAADGRSETPDLPQVPAAPGAQPAETAVDAAPETDEAADGLVVLRPVWDPYALESARGDFAPATDTRVALVGASGAQLDELRAAYPGAAECAAADGETTDALRTWLQRASAVGGPFGHLVWIAPAGAAQPAQDVDDAQAPQDSVLRLFRLIQALLAEGYGERAPVLTLVTSQAAATHDGERPDPAHAAVHGLAGSLAREYPRWQVRVLDLPEPGAAIVGGLRLPPHPQGQAYALRGQEWLTRRLVPVRGTLGSREVYRQGGVYAVIGGAGGLGRSWSRAMIESCGAHLVWLGRSPIDDGVRAAQQALAALGTAPDYLQADARDASSLARAWEEIRHRHGRIDGVVVSTLDDYDQRLSDMPEALFRRILAAKLEVAIGVAKSLRAQAPKLDFVAFFSSMAAFATPGGMAAYASACAFGDAFARCLASDWPCPVRVVNWGYWETGGGTRVAPAIKRLAEQRGVRPILPSQGWPMLHALLGGTLPQVAATRTVRPWLIEGYSDETWSACAQPVARSCMPAIQAYRAPPPPDANPAGEELSDWIARLLRVQLGSMGILRPGDAGERIEALRERAGILGKYRAWWRESLNVLQTYGHVRIEGDRVVAMAPGATADEEAWAAWRRRKPHLLAQPETRTLSVLVEDCLSRLADVLRGALPVTDILFPGGSMEKIEGLYRDNAVCDYFNDVVAGAIDTWIRARLRDDPAARIRIVEIGAGTGATTASVLARLKPLAEHIDDYRYTDLSRSFFNHAKRRFDAPCLSYGVFDIEKPLPAQGMDVGRYDIAIATNVLHATRDIRNTLRNAKAALRGGGLLVLNEISSKTVFASVLFGLIDGWSLAEDAHWRIPGSPGLLPERWAALLAQEGFAPVLFPASQAHGLGQQIVVAQSDGVLLQRAGDAAAGREPATPALPASPTAEAERGETIRTAIVESLSQALAVDAEAIEGDLPFSDFGVDSIVGVDAVQRLNQRLGLALNTTVLFDHSTVERLAAHILAEHRPVPERGGSAATAAAPQPPRGTAPATAPVQAAVDAGGTGVRETVLGCVAAALAIDRDTIEGDVPFADYGVDSIVGVDVVQKVNAALGTALSTTVLFDHATVDRLVEHIGHVRAPDLAPVREPVVDAVPAPAAPARAQTAPAQDPGIAVIGMAGQFPGAEDVDTLWKNLVGGVDPVTELPEHYLARDAYSPDKQPGKSYCKWGGPLLTRDCFDPMFFSISPREAKSMNPHQRLVLQESWKALEDAGYDPRALAGSRTGVFVGAEPSAYVHETFTGASDAIVASRLSYFLDFKGPAYVVNTGCSSSGVALHLACESLRNGETDLALAGGVFAVMGQTILVGLAQTEMLSRAGRCASFDAAADGMVMSEGVGMVALKRLDRALADGDPIYGVIRASGINQDGASNGITAPSGLAQQALIADLYRRHGIDPERIGYVEAHGTGTGLGDPVEANALVQAFRQFTTKAGYCAVGSIKSHIGHTSSSSGVIGLISVLLSLKHRQLPGLRHFERLNPRIEFEGSPFYPAAKPQPWHPVQGSTRMAAVSSFGHSGTNAHLVVEEFVSGPSVPRPAEGAPELIVLSARGEAQLAASVRRLRDFVSRGEDVGEPALADVAHTLQVGREAMEWRLAWVVHSVEELVEVLGAWLDGGRVAARSWHGRVEPERARRHAQDAAAARSVAGWLTDGALDELAAAWVGGVRIDWSGLRRDRPARRIHLPAYPFASERYWKTPVRGEVAERERLLHPLVHRNVSTLRRHAFGSVLDGQLRVLSDHVVAGRKLLPAVAHLEMARAALQLSLGAETAERPLTLKRIVWARALEVDERPVEVDVELVGGDEEIQFRILSGAASSEPRVHCQGVASLQAPLAPAALDMMALRKRIGSTAVSAEACYAALEAAGVQCGPTHRGLAQTFTGEGEVLAALRLPEAAVEGAQAYVLHPSILDAAFQATVALGLAEGLIGAPGDVGAPAWLPFALEAVDVHGPCRAELWAWIRTRDDVAKSDAATRRLDIDLCTADGEVRVRLRGLAVRRRVPSQMDLPAAVQASAPAPDASRNAVLSRLSGDEFFLRDHAGLLPAVVYLGLVRAAAVWVQGLDARGFSEVVWPRPLQVWECGAALETRIDAGGAKTSFCVVATSADGGETTYCQGNVLTAEGGLPSSDVARDLDAIRERCRPGWDAAACAAALNHTHGPGLMSLRALSLGTGEALALLELPQQAWQAGVDAEFHPSLLNGALLACVVFSPTRQTQGRLPMPLGVGRIRFHRPLPPRVHAHVRAGVERGSAATTVAPSSRVETFDVELLDDAGRLLVAFEGLTLVFPATRESVVYATLAWRAQAMAAPAIPAPTQRPPCFVLTDEAPQALHEALRAHWPDAGIERLPALAPDVPAALGDALGRMLALCRRLIGAAASATQPLLLLIPDNENDWPYRALAGLLKTVRLEHPRIAARMIVYETLPEAQRLDGWMQRVRAEIASPGDEAEIRYTAAGERQVAGLVELTPPATDAEPLCRPGAVVWVTGGLGGIGRQLVRHLGVACGARVVLSGRAEPSEEGLAFLRSLEREGAQVSYEQADVADPGSVARVLASIEQRYARLNGVVHCAGVIADDYLVNKTDEQVQRVLRPKVAGALALDAATAHLPLDWFVLCSSIASVSGNPGQADYAVANAFLDALAERRAEQVRRGLRSGRSLSVNWPLWRDGGMQMSRHHEVLMWQATGMVAMDSATGARALEHAMGIGAAQVLVAYGDRDRIRARLVPSAPPAQAAGAAAKADSAEDALQTAVSAELAALVARIQQVPAERIGPRRPLSEYGFDSIGFTELATELNARYGLSLMPTLFFEIADLAELAEHLLSRHRAALEAHHADARPAQAAAAAADSVGDALRRAVSAELAALVTRIQQVPAERIGPRRPLSEYGFDSIGFTELATELNARYGLSLMPTLFFEIADLAELAEHLLSRHRAALEARHAASTASAASAAADPGAVAPAPPLNRPVRPSTFGALERTMPRETDPEMDAIAIVGMAGKFPGASDPDALWDHLEQNRDLISEVPAERWDWRAIYGDPARETGKTRAKWGGFVADADRFDAGFFDVSPADAEMMEPQLRLSLETAWATLEDAGYRASALAGSKVGVFVGVSNTEYRDLLTEARVAGAVSDPVDPFPFMIPNRISYWFDFHGPSEVIDTASSSSLAAVHRAVESLRLGHCRMALAGGVNVLCHPRVTVACSRRGMLSEAGRCRSFDRRADGFVRSEGVGLLLLKPLRRAVEDGDHIHGLIRSSAENHGGRASSPYAPNGRAQKQLLIEACERAGIDPRSIGYIEAHGLGSALGDPIEVQAMTAAFAELHTRRGLRKPDHPYCALGSAKANLGHMEAAGGMGGLVKVLLMLRHGKIPGNPHLEDPNPYLQLQGTPFYLSRDTRDWPCQTIEDGRPSPRRAGVNSFGLGGSNVHLVIEQHVGAASPVPDATVSPVLVVLSAKAPDRLRAQAERLLGFLRTRTSTVALGDLAFTLQTGREQFAHRLAFAADSLQTVEAGLRDYLDDVHRSGLHLGCTEGEARASVDPTRVDAWIAEGACDRLAEAWVRGAEIDWRRLYRGAAPSRISLPTYPFARERYWVPQVRQSTDSAERSASNWSVAK